MNVKPALLVLAAALSGAVFAQTPPAPPAQKQAAESKDAIYGYQLMTDAERTAYHDKMRALKTPEERQAFRAEHHKLMQERAKERGVTLRDMPPAGAMGEHHRQDQKMHEGRRQGMHEGMHGAPDKTPAPAQSAQPPSTPPPR